MERSTFDCHRMTKIKFTLPPEKKNKIDKMYEIVEFKTLAIK